jgi:RNA polymerase sigma-70 factor (ECF subfamily)
VPASDSFVELMARLRAGDDEAATRVFQRFASRLIALARTRLQKQIQHKVDPEDVIQSVFKSLFLRCADGQLDVKNWDSLWTLLVTITLHKCGHQVRDFHRARRDVRKEVRAVPHADDSGARWEAEALDPTASQVAMLAETLERILRGVRENDRLIVELRLQGYTVAEISAQAGRTEYSVEAVLKKLRKRLKQMRDGEAQASEG